MTRAEEVRRLNITFSNGASTDIRDLKGYEEEVLRLLLKLLPDDLRNAETMRYILEQSAEKLDSLRIRSDASF